MLVCCCPTWPAASAWTTDRLLHLSGLCTARAEQCASTQRGACPCCPGNWRRRRDGGVSALRGQRTMRSGWKRSAQRCAPAVLLPLSYVIIFPSRAMASGGHWVWYDHFGERIHCSDAPATSSSSRLNLGLKCTLLTCAGGGNDGAVQGTAGPWRADVHPETHLKRGHAALPEGKLGTAEGSTTCSRVQWSSCIRVRCMIAPQTCRNLPLVEPHTQGAPSDVVTGDETGLKP